MANRTDEDVQIVRIYLTEQKAHLADLLSHLHDNEKVRGVTVFRGISGFGLSGKMHSSSLLDLSLDLPVVVEFFDQPDIVNRIVDHLLNEHIAGIEPGHIVRWSATLS